MLFVGMLYGANYSILKVVTPQYILPFGLIIYRVAAATLIFWLIGWRSNEKVDWKSDWKQFFLCAFFGVGINMLLFFKGVSLTSATNGSIIMTLTPIMVFITSLFLLKDTVTVRKTLGLILGLLGAIIIIYKPESSLSQGDWRGDLMVFFNTLSYGAYLVLAKPLLAKYKPITITKWIFLIGFFITLPAGFQEARVVDWSTWTSEAYWSTAYVIIGITVIAYLTNIWAMKRVNPTTVGVYIYVQPVFAILIANLFFDELFTLKHVIASSLVFLGVWLVVRRRS